jgi:hypothetical protein
MSHIFSFFKTIFFFFFFFFFLYFFLNNQISTRTKKPFSLAFQSNHSNCKQGSPLQDLNSCSRHEKMMSYTPRRKGQNFKEKCPMLPGMQKSVRE